MRFADLRRKHIRWVIQQNPVDIVIRRVEQVRKGGAYEEVESEHGPFTVRIYGKRTQIPREVSNFSGKKQVDTAYGLLADREADLKAGPRVTDTFDAYGETFEVVSVRPQIWRGEVLGYQAELERVK